MATNLRIIWDGNVPGLPEHRLSLNAFGGPLDKLRKAIKFIAASTVANAVGGSIKDELRGKKPLVDIQLSSIDKGSVDLQFECELAPGNNEALFVEDLAHRVVHEFLASVRAESRGQLRNRFVREYLDSLPPQLRRQRYSVVRNGREEDAYEFSEMNLAHLPGSFPSLVHVTGQIVGLGFEPAKSEVRIQPAGDTTVAMSATPAQVERAVTLRQGYVQALGVTGERIRLLWIRPSDAELPIASPEERTEQFAQRWHEVLRRLAQ
ncbi:hypothetical protein ACN28I_32630 [Archangium gephyra]|uniref:hypothetical protein n=1 Tax=Archangium gephyra TaxID=48 RepID=UPI003B7D3FE7